MDDKDVYYDIPIYKTLFSFIKQDDKKSNEDLVDISIQDIYQLEPYISYSEENLNNSNKNNFLAILFILLLFIFIYFLLSNNKSKK